MSFPSVLITRPTPEAEDFAASVANLGYGTLLDPLLTAQYFSVAEPSLPQAVVATSAHAFATPALPEWTRLPVFVMGENSKASARAAGYQNILSANGDFTALLKLIQATLVPGGQILYLRGETVRHDLQAQLPLFSIREEIVYAMRPAQQLRETTVAALRTGAPLTVTLFSPQTATVFARLVDGHGLIPALQRTNVLCLSDAVLESVYNLPWQRSGVAGQPDRQGMLAVLQTWMDEIKDE